MKTRLLCVGGANRVDRILELSDSEKESFGLVFAIEHLVLRLRINNELYPIISSLKVALNCEKQLARLNIASCRVPRVLAIVLVQPCSHFCTDQFKMETEFRILQVSLIPKNDDDAHGFLTDLLNREWVAADDSQPISADKPAFGVIVEDVRPSSAQKPQNFIEIKPKVGLAFRSHQTLSRFHVAKGFPSLYMLDSRTLRSDLTTLIHNDSPYCRIHLQNSNSEALVDEAVLVVVARCVTPSATPSVFNFVLAHQSFCEGVQAEMDLIQKFDRFGDTHLATSWISFERMPAADCVCVCRTIAEAETQILDKFQELLGRGYDAKTFREDCRGLQRLNEEYLTVLLDTFDCVGDCGGLLRGRAVERFLMGRMFCDISFVLGAGGSSEVVAVVDLDCKSPTKISKWREQFVAVGREVGV